LCGEMSNGFLPIEGENWGDCLAIPRAPNCKRGLVTSTTLSPSRCYEGRL
jgi:hypothetical protein